MESIYRMTYGVDLVFCIDVTGSMDHVLDTVKENALNFYQDFMDIMERKGKRVESLRVRIVAFRDYLADGDQAMMVSNFFELPTQAEHFRDCIQSIVAQGGGDDPEDGLEALAYAMKSEWNSTSRKRRHVIVVWSDAETHELGYGKLGSSYPKNMAKDFDELTEWWGCGGTPGVMDESAKRLILFTPDANYWSNISYNWNNVLHYVSSAGDGLRDCEFEEILSVICASI